MKTYPRYGRMRLDQVPGADELSWAYDAVSEIVDSPNPEDSLPLVLALVTEAPDEVVNYVAAGPLEDILGRHGPAVIDRILGWCTSSVPSMF